MMVERTLKERIEFIENCRKFFDKNKSKIMNELFEIFSYNLNNKGFRGWGNNLYIREDEYVITGSMDKNSTTIDNYEGRELFLVTVDSDMDVWDNISDNLEDIKRVLKDINYNVYKVVVLYQDDLEDDEIIEILKNENEDIYNKVISKILDDGIRELWDSYKEIYEDKIYNKFKIEIDYVKDRMYQSK